MTIAVLDYGTGNLHSVVRAVERADGKPEVADEPGAVTGADALIVPGVGHFGACMRSLRERKLDAALKDFAGTGRPMLGVCLGMQVLLDGSEEDPEPGLGLLPGMSRKLPHTVKVPHMGWNSVRWVGQHPLVAGITDGTRFYFVHSFAPDVMEGVTVGITEHGRVFSAVLARDNLFATQFHPEKSGRAGMAIYEAFVRTVSA